MGRDTKLKEVRPRRAEAILYLNGADPKTNSTRKFLRRKMVELRAEKMDQIREAAQKAMGETIGAIARSAEKGPPQEPNQKVYGGQPSDDNPQTHAIQEKFAMQMSITKLKKLNNETLIDMLSELLEGDASASFRQNADPDRLRDIKRIYLRAKEDRVKPLLHYSERKKVIKILMEAERQKHADDGKTARPAAEPLPQGLQTDRVFLSNLKDLQLIEHLRHLLSDKDFRSSAGPKGLRELQAFSAGISPPLFSFEKEKIIENIIKAAGQ